MNQEITNIIDFYKAGDIEEHTAENEIGRLLSGRYYVEVIFDDLENKNNSSYMAMVIPEIINGVFREKLVIDKDVVKTKLSSEKITLLLSKMMDAIPEINGIFYSFIQTHKDIETSFLDCIQLFINLYTNFIFKLPDEIFDTVEDFKTFIQQDTANILLAIQSENETSENIVNHILLNHTLPKIALQMAETLFKNINIPVEGKAKIVADQDYPESNVMHADIASHSTGVINPEWRDDLNPFYIPKQ